jgi:hypothetical protein
VKDANVRSAAQSPILLPSSKQSCNGWFALMATFHTCVFFPPQADLVESLSERLHSAEGDIVFLQGQVVEVVASARPVLYISQTGTGLVCEALPTFSLSFHGARRCRHAAPIRPG